MVSYCLPCWQRYLTRHWIVALLSIAGNSPLGAILSMGPLAMRVAQFTVADHTGAEIYCSTCGIWLNGPKLAEQHRQGKLHRANSSRRVD